MEVNVLRWVKITNFLNEDFICNKSLLLGYRPVEESSESEDETEAGSETSGDLSELGEGGEVPPAEVPAA